MPSGDGTEVYQRPARLPSRVACCRPTRWSSDSGSSVACAPSSLTGASQLTGLPERRAIVVSRLAIEAETALMDWWESPDVDYAPMVAREIKAMMRAYIGLYAPPSAPAKA